MAPVLEKIPEIYFTKLDLVASLLEGEEEKAVSQFRIALKVMEAFEEDFLETKWFVSRVCEYTSEQRNEVIKLLEK